MIAKAEVKTPAAPVTNEQILAELQRTRAEFKVLISMVAVNDKKAMVTKETLMTLTGLGAETINTFVSQGKIKKRGELYSYRSLIEYWEVYGAPKPRGIKRKDLEE